MPRNSLAITVLTSGMLPDSRANLGWSSNEFGYMRLAASALLYHYTSAVAFDYPRPLILASGGKIKGSENPSLSQIAEQELQEQFLVPKKDILIEDQSKHTPANAKNSLQIIEEQGLLEKITLITNDFHLPIAESLFKFYGRNKRLQMISYSAEGVIKGMLNEYPEVRAFLKEFNSRPYLKKQTTLKKILEKAFHVPLIGKRVLPSLIDYLVEKQMQTNQGHRPYSETDHLPTFDLSRYVKQKREYWQLRQANTEKP